MNPFLATDGYKTGHHMMYPDNTSLVYSNGTPRSNKYAPKGIDKLMVFGPQMVMKQIKEMFDKYFFKRNAIDEFHDRVVPGIQGDLNVWNKEADRVKKQVCNEIKEEYSLYLGYDYDVSHIEKLWDLGYLPIHVKAIPEGTLVPMGVPVLTIYNTLPEFYWLTNFLETIISNLLWKPMTSATIAYEYKKVLIEAARKTDKENIGFIEFQGHDFSMRGMDSINATISSGLGHATCFLGSDSLPVIHGARKYYNEKEFIIGSVNATEHSVMCAGSKNDEIVTFRRLLDKFPTGILSIVSDTWDLWKVITEYLPQLKDKILSRDGKLVIRPDSGDPVDIICGKNSGFLEILNPEKETGNYDPNKNYFSDFIINNQDKQKDIYFKVDDNFWVFHPIEFQELIKEYSQDTISELFFERNRSLENISDSSGNVIELIDIDNYSINEQKGVIEILWNIFGGTINEQGYKVLDPHIGAIYGDSITIDRAKQICERLELKGFASTNIVLGIGSFTYQYNTRDTFGFAMKATYTETMLYIGRDPKDNKPSYFIQGKEIFKDPVTDDGTKKSAKGLLTVIEDKNGNLVLKDQVTWNEEQSGILDTIFLDGKLYNETTLTKIRKKINDSLRIN